ncbi:MAG: CvpA family protein [Muribaculaceae bacterium]|nr:CvpA family protein [Muribaculaceae bacterium]
MANMLYLVLVIVVALYSLASGFRRGITRQLGSLLGFAFGAVASRVITPALSDFGWGAQMSQASEFAHFTSNLLCASLVYGIVYALFMLLNPIIRSAMSVFNVGMFNRLVGAFFTMVKNLLWISILLNLYLCLSPGSDLMRYEEANDGNLVAAVMGMTHGILGCYDAEDFAHFYQLREAKRIS